MPTADTPRRSVLYATNDDAEHLHMLFASIESLRRLDAKVPVTIGASNDLSGTVRARLRRLDASILPLDVPPWTMAGISSRQLATFLKWFAVGQIGPRFEHVLYVDSDTQWFAEPGPLIRKLSRWDFAAREDLGKQRHGGVELIGSFLAMPEVDWRIMAKTRQAVSPRTLDLPVFNTGVMGVGRRCARWVARRTPVMHELCALWCDGKIPYPSTNRWVMEEMAATIMLSTIPSLRWRRLTRQESPLYIELRGGVAEKPGAVVHIWSLLYPFFLEDFRGPAARRRFEKRFRREART